MIRAECTPFEMAKCASCGVTILFSLAKCSCDECGRGFCPSCIATKANLLCPIRTHGFFCSDCVTQSVVDKFSGACCISHEPRSSILGEAYKLRPREQCCPECDLFAVTFHGRTAICHNCGWTF